MQEIFCKPVSSKKSKKQKLSKLDIPSTQDELTQGFLSIDKSEAFKNAYFFENLEQISLAIDRFMQHLVYRMEDSRCLLQTRSSRLNKVLHRALCTFCKNHGNDTDMKRMTQKLNMMREQEEEIQRYKRKRTICVAP